MPAIKVETVRDIDLVMETIEEIIQRHNVQRGAAIPILQAIQAKFGYVAPAFLEHVADATNTHVSDLYSIITFYSQFRLEPLGDNVVKICHGTACHLAGADQIAHAFAQETGAKEGQTSPDGMFTVERVACLGCCSLAPVVMINEETFGRLTPERVRKIVAEIRKADRQVPAPAVN